MSLASQVLALATRAGQEIKAVRASGARYNAAVAAPAAGFAADTYLTGSSIPLPVGIQAKTMYRLRFTVSKTAAGVAAPVVTVRIGTAGAIGDTSRGVLTFAAQTAVIDEGLIEVLCTFRAVGSGTAAVLHSVGVLAHRLSVTGLSVDVTGMKVATSAGFDSTMPASIIGVSVNGGAAAAWTIAAVQAELVNLA